MKKLVGTLLIGLGILTAMQLQAIPLDANTLAIIATTTPIPADELPATGNYYSVAHPEYPPFPSNFGMPAWQIGTGKYIVDDVDFAPMTMSRVSRMNSMDDLNPDDTGGFYSDSFNYQPPTNGLYLTIESISSGWVNATLHGGTNAVYSIWSASNLLPGWTVEAELWPTEDLTNAMAFNVFAGNQQNFFLKAEDWTGVMSNGLYCWWSWLYFGNLNVSATDLDLNGQTLGDDFTNNIAPAVFQFNGIDVTNNYVNSSSAAAQLDVSGLPYYIAVSVDDTNYAADADWQIFTGTNITINLGSTEGWHDVWIGLRGHGDDTTNGVWQMKRLKLDLTPPLLVVTNPVMAAGAATMSVPLVQIQGYSPEELDSIHYDLSNAMVVVTNQDAGITDQFYDTNTWELTVTLSNAWTCL